MAKKHSIEYFINLAKAKNGKCLSKTYNHSHSKLKWQCDKGHQWEATPNNIKQGKWCPICAGNKKLSLKDLNELAEKRGGKCLSVEYINCSTKLEWECTEEHRWFSVPSSVKAGTWCPKCGIKKNSEKQKLSITEMYDIARKRNGKCLSKEYINSKTKLLWECEFEHKWEATPKEIKRGRWCPSCAGRMKLSIEEMHDIAKERGGKCLSKEYVNANSKIEWECSEGHKWSARPGDIKTGKWCPVCAGTQKHDETEMHRVAENRGGKCLTTVYVNNRTKVQWQCSEGHLWNATLRDVKSGRWCPECGSGLGERICKAYFEQLFKLPFPKSKPQWLKDETGISLELDGYNEKLKIAFEHQGRQHYELSHYTDTREKFAKRKKYDKLKANACKSNDVKLIEIPEIFLLTRLKDLKDLIVNECITKEIEMPLDWKSVIIDLKAAYSPKFINELIEIAIEREGKCLSDTYLGVNYKLEWECKKGHRWYAMPSKIKSGQWCPICGKIKSAKKRIKYTIIDMQKIALEQDGKCLSDKYVNSKTKLLWECSKGHQWYATRDKVQRGTWCPKCGGTQKLTILDMQILAAKKDGKCLSVDYINNRTKLVWECKHGHIWSAMPTNIQKGTWCPDC